MSHSSFSERLLTTLAELQRDYTDLLARSAIQNIDPNRGGGGRMFLGFPKWGWRPDEALVAERTCLLAEFEEWFALFRLLHRSALPETTKRIDSAVGLLRRWLARDGRDHSIPATTDQARATADSAFQELRALVALATHGPHCRLIVPDTNALLRRPDLASYGALLGEADFTAVLVTTALAELDELKDRGRTPELRDAAGRVVRRIKGLRDRGDLRAGVPLAGKSTVRVEHREVRTGEVLDWLDPDVLDDRILAAALDMQARHLSATVTLASRDINLHNKAAAVGMPFVEVPD